MMTAGKERSDKTNKISFDRETSHVIRGFDFECVDLWTYYRLDTFINYILNIYAGYLPYLIINTTKVYVTLTFYCNYFR